VSTNKQIEAGITIELGGILYRLSERLGTPLDETAKKVYLSETYQRLSRPDSLLYKEDLLKLVSLFEDEIRSEIN
jgi:hypothetical protein